MKNWQEIEWIFYKVTDSLDCGFVTFSFKKFAKKSEFETKVLCYYICRQLREVKFWNETFLNNILRVIAFQFIMGLGIFERFFTIFLNIKWCWNAKSSDTLGSAQSEIQWTLTTLKIQDWFCKPTQSVNYTPFNRKP